jgi:hypothetical protein
MVEARDSLASTSKAATSNNHRAWTGVRTPILRRQVANQAKNEHQAIKRAVGGKNRRSTDGRLCDCSSVVVDVATRRDG